MIDILIYLKKNLKQCKQFYLLNRGIEREIHRVKKNSQGIYSLCRNRSEKLGNPLYHPNITLDFSNSQIEIVTDVFSNISDLQKQLHEIHQWLLANADDESYWFFSSPPPLCDDDLVEADFGISNVGMWKHVYRLGLGLRYPKKMQSISGIHYNISPSEAFWGIIAEYYEVLGFNIDNKVDFRSDQLMNCVRNLLKDCWLFVYLFGQTPFYHKSLVDGETEGLEIYGNDAVYYKNGISLRNSPIGYQSEVQNNLNINFNNHLDYCKSIMEATLIPIPEYMNRGRQLNENALQIENEYYCPIRPKCTIKKGERTITAMVEKGVEYIEIRLVDIDNSTVNGVSNENLIFMDLFFIYNLLNYQKEPNFNLKSSLSRKNLIATSGLMNPLLIYDEYLGKTNCVKGTCMFCCESDSIDFNESDGMPYSICTKRRASYLLNDMYPLASYLDEVEETRVYTDVLNLQINKISNINLLPSKVLINAVRNSYYNYFSELTEKFMKDEKNKINPDIQAKWNLIKKQSLEVSSKEDTKVFENYVIEENYKLQKCLNNLIK